MTYVSGWEWTDPAPGLAGSPVPRGPRHAVPAGSRISVCDRPMAYVQDQPFAQAVLGTLSCSDCLALDRIAASVS